jgi:hypothetical protein
VRKKCSCDFEKLLKFMKRQRIFKNFEITRQFFQTVKVQNNFW